MKTVLKIGVALLLLVVVAGFVLVMYAGSLAKTAIEKGGTSATGVSTTLDSASLRPLAGELSIGGLQVANPDGFQQPHFMTVNTGEFRLRTGSLLEDTVELPNITLTGIDVRLEKTADGANYDVILENLKRGAGDKPSEPKEAGKGYVIREIVIKDVNVYANMSALPPVEVPIPEIRLTDVGSESDNGVAMGELAQIIMQAVFASILEAGVQLPAQMLALFTDGLKGLPTLGDLGIDVLADTGAGLKDVVGDATSQATDQMKNAGDKASDAIDDLGKGLGGLVDGLGGGKKK